MRGYNSLKIRPVKSISAVKGSVCLSRSGISFLMQLVAYLIVFLSSNSCIIFLTINLNKGMLYGHYTVKIKISSYILYEIRVGKSFFYNQSSFLFVIFVIREAKNAHKCILSGYC